MEGGEGEARKLEEVGKEIGRRASPQGRISGKAGRRCLLLPHVDLLPAKIIHRPVLMYIQYGQYGQYGQYLNLAQSLSICTHISGKHGTAMDTYRTETIRKRRQSSVVMMMMVVGIVDNNK